MENKRCIILTGMPGSGKSTIGTLLAEAMQMPFIDTDKILESVYGRRLEDITRAFARVEFLDAECSVIESLNIPGSLIATGGSVIYRPQAMRHLKKLGAIVYLRSSLPVIEERVARCPERGISFGPGQSLADLYHERCSLYQKYADLECSTDIMSAAECARYIRAQLTKGASQDLPG